MLELELWLVAEDFRAELALELLVWVELDLAALDLAELLEVLLAEDFAAPLLVFDELLEDFAELLADFALELLDEEAELEVAAELVAFALLVLVESDEADEAEVLSAEDLLVELADELVVDEAVLLVLAELSVVDVAGILVDCWFASTLLVTSLLAFEASDDEFEDVVDEAAFAEVVTPPRAPIKPPNIAIPAYTQFFPSLYIL